MTGLLNPTSQDRTLVRGFMSGQDRSEKVAATQDIVEPSQCQGFNVLLAHADEDEESTYP